MSSHSTFYTTVRDNVLLYQLFLLLYFTLHYLIQPKLPKSLQFQITLVALTLALIALFAIEETRQKLQVPLLVAEYGIVPFAYFYDLEIPQGNFGLYPHESPWKRQCTRLPQVFRVDCNIEPKASQVSYTLPIIFQVADTPLFTRIFEASLQLLLVGGAFALLFWTLGILDHPLVVHHLITAAATVYLLPVGILTLFRYLRVPSHPSDNDIKVLELRYLVTPSEDLKAELDAAVLAQHQYTLLRAVLCVLLSMAHGGHLIYFLFRLALPIPQLVTLTPYLSLVIIAGLADTLIARMGQRKLTTRSFITNTMALTFFAGSLSEVVTLLEGNEWKDWVYRMMVGVSIIWRVYRGRPKRIDVAEVPIDRSVE